MLELAASTVTPLSLLATQVERPSSGVQGIIDLSSLALPSRMDPGPLSLIRDKNLRPIPAQGHQDIQVRFLK